MTIDEVMTAPEIAGKVSVSHKTILTECKKWEKQGMARKSNGTWIVDRRTAEKYIKEHPK